MLSPSQLTGAVLAGGESRRMGRDKALLILDGLPLWQRQVRLLRGVGAGVVGVVRRPGQPPIELPPDVPLWQDSVSGIGPLAGLHAALAACPTNWMAVVATDLPRLDLGWFSWLAEQCGPDRGAVACHPDGRFEPLAAIYPLAARAEVGRRVAGRDFSLQEFVKSLLGQELLASVPLPVERFAQTENWNTPREGPLNGAARSSAT